ncbi:FtsJ-domain-containing protein [Delitschia confertaspora ATCC 74209]|uniref:rRNA methyltransferase 2, mitochondrial n=1 Tax=Delitschia confertaspora ATCC 74209 TaxID=1513339 RepID=A0A9P4JJA5_9PLEO|nr:FtsJ-domain-containing protein [Delitschia confertaspora ATCC 74209]
MLSRRIFQQLTNTLLLGFEARPACNSCIASTCRPLRTLIRRQAPTNQLRDGSSSSSTRWKSRQGKDFFAKSAKVAGFKSRAAFKLLEMDQKYKLFKPGQTVIDLGYAPGSWSQVAVSRTTPNGRVIGIDLIPAQPPKGVSTIQGNFLSPAIQADVRAYVQDPNLGRPRKQSIFSHPDEDSEDVTEEEVQDAQRGYIDLERRALLEGMGQESLGQSHGKGDSKGAREGTLSLKERDKRQGRVVDVVLSDMWEPWHQTTGYGKRSLSDPYFRLMNTSGMAFRDHAGSMDLCMAALTFCFDTLHTGGHFLCKFYQGAEDKEFEKKLRKLFQKVHREKPESSRSDSKEAYFVGLRRKESPTREEVFAE